MKVSFLSLLFGLALIGTAGQGRAQLTDWNQLGNSKDSVYQSGRVFLKNGSVVMCKNIIEAEPVQVETFDGSRFVYAQNDLSKIEYGKVRQEKSGVIAAVLSLVLPGAGNYYVGQNKIGTALLVLDFVGAFLMVRGSEKVLEYPEYNSGYRVAEENNRSTVMAGAGAALISCSALTGIITSVPAAKPSFQSQRLVMYSKSF